MLDLCPLLVETQVFILTPLDDEVVPLRGLRGISTTKDIYTLFSSWKVNEPEVSWVTHNLHAILPYLKTLPKKTNQISNFNLL